MSLRVARAQHYIPSLLALAGLEGETDCSGAMTYVHWWGEGDDMHLETFYRDEVSGDLIEQMRCGGPSPMHGCAAARVTACFASQREAAHLIETWHGGWRRALPDQRGSSSEALMVHSGWRLCCGGQ